jgi:AraC-like DNA-binding protein
MPYYCSSAYARLAVAAAQKLGIPADNIVDELALRESLQKSTARIPAYIFSRLWTAMKDASNDPYFGLHIGEATAGLYHHFIFYTFIKNVPGLIHAIEHIVNYHDILGSMLTASIERRGLFTLYRESICSEFVDFHQVECLLAAYALAFKDIMPGKELLAAVRFQHAQVNGMEEYQRIFGCTISFNQPHNELVLISHKKLLRHYQIYDPVATQQLEPIINNQLCEMRSAISWKDRVAREVLNFMRLRKKPVLNKIARELTVSVRLLQVRLQKENATYSEILENERRKLALEYISQHQLDLFEINTILGFSDQSAFSRAFKRWTGSSPKRYRRTYSKIN